MWTIVFYQRYKRSTRRRVGIRIINMKLLIGRILLGCLLAFLVLAEEPVTENVETAKAVVVPVVAKATVAVPTVDVPTVAEPIAVESAISADTVVVTSAPAPIKSKIFSTEETTPPTYETYSRPQVYFPKPTNDDHHHHHHHDVDDDHHHHHHHAPVPQRPPPHSHNHYPGYYPSPYYPAPYPYSAPVYAPVPPPPMHYPYYPQQHPQQQPNYYPTHVKPVTVIQTVPVESDNSGNTGQNFVKPGELIHHGTGYLWNLIDQKNTELWNLFGNKHGDNSGDKDTDTIHEVVVTYQDPPIGTTIIKPGKPSYSNGNNNGGGNWYIKGKNAQPKGCDHDH